MRRGVIRRVGHRHHEWREAVFSLNGFVVGPDQRQVALLGFELPESVVVEPDGDAVVLDDAGDVQRLDLFVVDHWLLPYVIVIVR